MNNPFTYEKFLWIFEHDNLFDIDETEFYFDDDPDKIEHMIGCLRKYDNPYWVGECDIPNGCEYRTASELLEAKIFNRRSMKDRWENIAFYSIGGISVEEWIDMYHDKFF